jgi:hypothetical protein
MHRRLRKRQSPLYASKVCAGMQHYGLDAGIVNRHILFINDALTRLPRTWE